MIGLVLVTHGNLALEFISAMQHVVGKQEQVEAVCVGSEMCIRDRAISIMDRAPVEIIAGINLPMLIKLASLRKDKSLKEAVEGAQEAGKKYINIASQLLGA